MKIVILTALLIAAVASGRLDNGEYSLENQTQWPWQVGKLYRYDVESHTLARLQEGTSSGNAFRARFIVRVKAPGRLQAKLENPEHAQVHQELDKDKELPQNLEYKPIQDLEKPFEISLSGGRVLSLTLPSSLDIAQENLLKGLIGVLQVDLSTHRTSHSAHNGYNKETQQGQFRKMETDVTGDCETLYTVSPVASEWRRELPNFAQNEDPIEISKSKSYGHCHHRVAFHFGVPQGAEWTGTAHNTEEEQFIKRSTISRMLAGKQGPIYKAETTSTVHVHPHMYGKQKAEVHSHVKLTLVTYEQDQEAEWQKPEDGKVIKNLLYSMSTKQVTISDKSSSSSSESREQSHGQGEESQGRDRRSVKSPRNVMSTNKRHSDEDSSSSSSSDSTSAYVNDDVPNMNEPPHASMYKKENPMNAQKIVQEIAQQLQNPNNMPKADFLSKFNLLMGVITSMTYEQLSQTSRSIEVAKSSNNIVKADMWMIYRDAVANAGTLPAFQQIQAWIHKKKIEGEEAAQVVASMVNSLRFPTKEVMTQFFKLAMSDEVRQQKYLNNTALIAATRFINMGQVNNETAHSYYPTHTFGRMVRQHDEFVVEEVLPRLRNGMEEAIQEQDSQKAQVYIKAIGNLGHRSVLEVFAPYIEGKIPLSKYLRVRMVQNLRVLAHQRDHYARAALYSILRNTAEPYEIRVAAIHNIFTARPTSAMMQAMAQMTHEDPSVHVRAALKSGIESAAELKDPRYWDLSRTAQAARSSLTQEKFGKQYSSRKYDDFLDSDYEFGIMSKLSSIGSEDNLLPKYLEYALKSKTSGWNSISASFSSFQQFVDLYKQQWQHGDNSEPNLKYSANKISEMLKIKRNPRNPLEAAFSINLMNQQRYYTFSEDDLRQLPQAIRQYFADLSKGVEKHYTKVLNQAQVTIIFPVAMGMPFLYKYSEPTVVHIQAKAKGDVKFPSQEQNDLAGSIEKEIQFTYARNLDGSVGFLDTLSNQIASVGVINKVQVNIPVKMQLEMRSGEVKIQLEHLRPEQDHTIAHYSVWPYSTNQKKDSLVTVSQDAATKVITRNDKVASIDTQFGLITGMKYQLQGYSYSSDYKSLNKMFQSRDLVSNIALALNQKDVAMTHYNFKYIGKKSQNKHVTFSAVYDTYYNQKQNTQEPLVAADMKDVTPNSAERRQEMVKRVASGINTAKVQVVDLSATFGPKTLEYVLTGAMAHSPVDSKIQYAFHAGKNEEQQNNQLNGVLTVNKPQTISMNFLEALQKDMKMSFEAAIKSNGNENEIIRIQGQTERSQKYAEALKNLPSAKKCTQEIARNNLYQHSCHKMIVMAHAPDFFKASVSYQHLSPYVKDMAQKAYRMAQHLGFWYAEINPYKISSRDRMDIEVQTNYLDNSLNLMLNSEKGEFRVKNVPIPKVASRALSTYAPFKSSERVYNYYSHHQYQPYCSIDGNKIKTFSNRKLDYTVTKSWHVVMQDAKREKSQQPKDQLVVLARRPNEQQQEIYISYRSATGKDLEIEIQPASEGSKPQVKVNTNAKKVSEGDLTMYWDDAEETPLLQFYTQPDGVMMLNIGEKRLRAMYDGQRLVVLSKETRDNNRGICGYMSGEPRDDYKTPKGLVDRSEHFGASYSLHDEHSEPKTQQLQTQAQEQAYQNKYKYTAILSADDEWHQNALESSSSEEKLGSHNVYRARSYSKQLGECQLQQQVQYYENHGEICISTTPLDSCQSRCRGEGYKVQAAQVVCRPKLDQQFQEYRNQIRQGENPQVAGVPKIRQYRVPTSCTA